MKDKSLVPFNSVRNGNDSWMCQRPFFSYLDREDKSTIFGMQIISASILLSKAWFGLKLGGSGSRN